MPYKSLRKGEAATARSGAAPTADELEVTEEQLEKWQAVIFHFVPMDEANFEKEGEADHGGSYRGLKSANFRADEETAEEQLIAQERLDKATRAIASLTPIERRILIDNDTKGLPTGFVEATREAALIRLRRLFESS